jgi:hypothetical protein
VGSGQTYATLAAAYAAEGGGTLSDTLEFEIHGSITDDTVTLDSTTTSATNYIRIYGDVYHNGDPATSGAAKLTTTTVTSCIEFDPGGDSHVRVEDLILEGYTYHVDFLFNYAPASDSDYRFIKLLCIDAGTYHIRFNKMAAAGTINFLIFENIIMTGGSRGIWSNSNQQASNLYCYACTVAGITGTSGMKNQSTGWTFIAKNCYSEGWENSYSTGTEYCASDDTTTPGTNKQDSQSPTWEDATNDIYRLESGDLVGDGKDLSSDGNWSFSDDIEKLDRSGWDIGASNVAHVVAGRVPRSVVAQTYFPYQERAF